MRDPQCFSVLQSPLVPRPQLFEDRLGLQLEKEDEMECLVKGTNFLLKAIPHEAFSYENGEPAFIAAESASGGMCLE